MSNLIKNFVIQDKDSKFFWKKIGMGATKDIKEAYRYTEDVAEEIIAMKAGNPSLIAVRVTPIVRIAPEHQYKCQFIGALCTILDKNWYFNDKIAKGQGSSIKFCISSMTDLQKRQIEALPGFKCFRDTNFTNNSAYFQGIRIHTDKPASQIKW